MIRALTVALLAVLGAPGLVLAGAGDTFRLTDRDGVTYITNAPTDPRYRPLSGASGTARGWLRIPESIRTQYAEEIREISGRHGVNAWLVESVIRAESAFNPWAVSRKGARGLMQLMPQTASALGVRNSFDPRQNIDGGVRHLRYLLDRYPGNVALALAAYNAGENAVDYYRGIPPYPETQLYVQKILGGSAGSAGRSIQIIYRYAGPDGTVTYSNIPPIRH
ncbi:MAG TPA: lytic transglycosylase domain-containing protein [Methylomirabilota bacterium]|nr:lytic transglycosylase domain-containing protein [Methylomirabilota bacterium]